MINPEITKTEVETFLKANHYHPFYSDNYWIKDGGSDYSGITLCEAYCRAKFPEAHPTELFRLTVELEYILNQTSRLAIIGKRTFDYKDELKTKFGAKWNPVIKKWHVDAEKIKDPAFHDYCYDRSHNFRFRWITND